MRKNQNNDTNLSQSSDPGRLVSERTHKRILIRATARRAGVTIRAAERVYNALLLEIVNRALNGSPVNLTGFGRFYVQKHTGHFVQLTQCDDPSRGYHFASSGLADSPEWKPDYFVMRFSTSRSLSRVLASASQGTKVQKLPDDDSCPSPADFA